MKKHFSIVLIMAMLLMSAVSVASAANTDYIRRRIRNGV